MHYIRFLKTPKVIATAGKVTLTATITLTTDLGETFFPEDVDLIATLRSPDKHGDIYLRRSLAWTPGMRSLPISLDLTRCEIGWPAKLHVSQKIADMNADDFHVFHGLSDYPAFVSVWSEPLNPLKGNFEAPRRVERRFFPLNDRPLRIWEDTGDSIARHLWDGSLVLTAFLDRLLALQAPNPVPLLEQAIISATFKRLNVLELGCGCGIVGIALAQAIPDCEVTLTDLPEVKELVDQNVKAANLAISSKVNFEPLDWEQPIPRPVASKLFDIIIAAECIYNSDSIPPLIRTLQTLVTRSPKAVILISTKFRHKSELEFFNLAGEAGLLESSKFPLPIPGLPGQGYGDFSTDVNVHILHGRGYKPPSPPGIELQEAIELRSSGGRTKAEAKRQHLIPTA